MAFGVAGAFAVCMIFEPFFNIVGGAGVVASVLTKENVCKPHLLNF